MAVIGAAVPGRCIALMLASRSKVRIYDPASEVGEEAVAFVEEHARGVVTRKGSTTPGSVMTTGNLEEAVSDAWLVIEAVPEHLQLKRLILAELDRVAAPDAILASTSFSYPTSRLVEGLTRPDRVVSMHFYAPPQQAVVDLMASGHTDRRVMKFLMGELSGYGLQPFEARREGRGFAFHRIWAAVQRESLAVVADGVSTPQDIDSMWEASTGLAEGPFRTMDRVGLDIVLDIENHYSAENPTPATGPRELLQLHVDAGHLGVKTGRGFYDDYSAPS
ncbi:3-hydroxyacyl-CoA dehydrogenase family protein [Streptomyces vinaceus]|uniref:3-hydroxyacyl-CoA dehydrogenase family protein n=1 Tax=Streptomyces vinaceus TaxID=1960 RepID=UPI0035DA3A66